MSSYRVTSEESIILRDGKPFGNGEFGGNSLTWPLPQTLTGMVRTSVGFSRGSDYFSSDDNCEEILKVSIEKILPLAKIGNNFVPHFPLPADIVLTNRDNEMLKVNQLSFKQLSLESGTDITNREWLIPMVDLKEKPAKERPLFCNYDFFNEYLFENIDKKDFDFDEIGIAQPINDTRIHNGIKKETGTVDEGKLFCNSGFYFKSKAKKSEKNIPLAINFSLKGTDEKMVSDVYLGAERKRASIDSCKSYFPEFPKSEFNDKSFLKIVLTTQGDFGSWVPEWLAPNLDGETIEWVTIPNSEYKIRLRSAVVIGWEGVSGWDYRKTPKKPKGQPKAMKKLVKAGSVYIIELENSDNSEEIAKLFWGGNLNPQEKINNGYNQTIIGTCTVEEN